MRPWIPLLGCFLALGLGACLSVGGDIPAVTGPLPQPAAVETRRTDPGAGLHLPDPWLFYSQPPAVYGVPVWQAPAGTELAVTGRWHAPLDLTGSQPWVLMSEIWAWYRLDVNLEPWGRVHVWSQMPAEWITGDRAAIPWVEPPWGKPWDTVPFSLGHVLVPPAAHPMALRVCPQTVCPILERPTRGQAVPVTGYYEDAQGQRWYRVEFRHTILWAEARAGALRLSLAGQRRRGGDIAAGYRSCEPVVMFPPPPHTLCPVDAAGRFVDGFEREFDGLDPIFGRLPLPAPEATGAVAPAAPKTPVPAVPDAAPRAMSDAPASAAVDYRVPDTYPRDVPGLDYEWELVFEDQSTRWDWTVADEGACYDALRVHLGKRPQLYGLRQATVILQDPSPDYDWDDLMHQGVVHFPRTVAWESGMPADGAMVHVGCRNANHMTPRHDAGEFVCEVHPLWGHTGTRQAAHRLHGALAQALATYLGYAIYQEEAIKARHWEREDTWAQPPYLYPRDPVTGEPTGEGPCLSLIEVAGE